MEQTSLLPAVWNVPAIFRKRLGRQVGRQRAMFEDGHLLLVLHAPPGPEDVERQGRFFWRQPDGTWQSSHHGGGAGAVARHLDEYQSVIEELERVDDAATSAQDYFDVVYRIDPVQRAARHLHEVLQEARKLCPDDEDIINFRDQAYQLERTSELLLRDARNGMEFEMARRAEEQAASSFQMSVAAHRLNVLAAFFFPIITLCTIFSTNVQHGLENAEPPWPWLGILGTGLVLGVLLKSMITSAPPGPRRPS